MSVTMLDPFTSALRYVTAPYAQGAATQDLALAAAIDGRSAVQDYSFAVFSARYGLTAVDASYVLTLRAELDGGPRTVEVDYVGSGGTGTAVLVVPDGTLPGTGFALATPRGDSQLMLTALRERPAPSAGAPSGPDKWQLTALLGNTARLLWTVVGERQVLAATTGDVAGQRHLATARAASLDRLGEALGVVRLLPGPYRVDMDPGTLALYHLDDAVSPVLDAMGEHPGVSHGALRGQAGRFGGACLTAGGGLTIPDAAVFEVAAQADFTVELFARPVANGQQQASLSVLAAKRPHIDDDGPPGWRLALEPVPTVPRPDAPSSGGRPMALTFRVTDRAGTQVAAVSGPLTVGADWFHVAGVIDRTTGQAYAYFNGTPVATRPLGGLGAVGNCADVGLGGDRTGTSRFGGQLDEVRLSTAARHDFSHVLGGGAQPYQGDADTIALYHLDETDDWIDEARGLHYAVNHGAGRDVPARFGGGLRFDGDPLPEPHCAAEREFQQLLQGGLWDPSLGGTQVTVGPYARYGYRQGGISLTAMDNRPHPVMVNDQTGVAAAVRGRVTTACYGFVPQDVAQTVAAFATAQRSAQEAIDYFGDWYGEPEPWFAQMYMQYGVTEPHEPCPLPSETPTYARVPGAPDLAFDAGTSFTVEAMVKPDHLDDDYPRAVVASRSSGLRAGEANPGEPGWALTVGSYGCIPDNVRWTVGDAAGNLVAVQGAFGLADGAFHHVAGVVDRDAGTALLFVDGAEVAKAPLAGLGAAAGPGDIYLGNDPAGTAPYAGVLDEVRLSGVARRTFHPVLGESDDRYRLRLALFEPRRLPTIATLQAGVRALSLPATTADAVASQATALLLGDGPPPNAGQLDVLETDSTRFCASLPLRILPAVLQAGDSIAADGTTPADEATAAGTGTFHKEALLRHADGAGLLFPSESGRWMVLAAAQMLEALAARVLALDAAARVSVQRGWEPASTDLHAAGRALDLTLVKGSGWLDLGHLAALVHEVGAAYAAYERGAGSPYVRLSVSAGLDLDVAGPAVAPLGQAVTLSVARPAIATPAMLEWRLLDCGAGSGTLVAAPDGSCQLTATAAGEVTVQVRYPLADGGHLVGARRLTLAPTTLDGCAVLAGDGREDVTELEACGAPDPDFRPAYLVRADDAGLDFASEAARMMQLPLERALLVLAGLAAAEPGSPRITVAAAYDPAAATLQSVGRGLIVAPSSTALTAARLGALAFLAGFGYIERRRYPPTVYASVPAGDRFEIVRGPVERVWPNARLSGQGVFQAGEFAAAGPPDPGFNGGMLHPFTGSGVTLAAGVSNAMQASLASALTGLVAVLQSGGIAGDLEVVAGFDPTAAGLASVGRAVRLRHPSLGADRLAGYALQAGFGFVHHEADAPGGPDVYAAAYTAAGPPPAIATGSDVLVNTVCELQVRPQLALAGQLTWCIMPYCPGAATLSTALPDPQAPPGNTHKVLRGTSDGNIVVTASFSLGDAAEPYQFLIVPRGDATPRLTKDQYDDLMNFLLAYCPLGVGAVTRSLRAYVRGFPRPPRWDDLPTGRTFARYRTRP